MNRNQKIALGCGGGGCLGLILLVIVCAVLVVGGYIKAPGIYSPDSNYNSNYNRNSNYNSNDNLNSNSDSSSSAAMSEDDKHKLFAAAASAQDKALMRRVMQKLGVATAASIKFKEYSQFAKEHVDWARKNAEFIQSVNTPEKARAYVEAHIND